MHNQNPLLFSLVCSAMAYLAACSMQDKSASSKVEINSKYLACYALDVLAKKQCTNVLANKYINRKWHQDEEYMKAFQFEAEKSGFKHFLNDLKLPCETIKDGPVFAEDKQAYLVQCSPEHQYFMQFNYETKEWKLIKEKNNNER